MFDRQLWHFDAELGGGDHLITLPDWMIQFLITHEPKNKLQLKIVL
jgi:hypothetical protein